MRSAPTSRGALADGPEAHVDAVLRVGKAGHAEHHHVRIVVVAGVLRFGVYTLVEVAASILTKLALRSACGPDALMGSTMSPLVRQMAAGAPPTCGAVHHGLCPPPLA